ncbi:MAG TPA: hypothetical protein VF168_08455 [Trueperaceae bacterium]
MDGTAWDRLSAPFLPQQMTWRVQELAPDRRGARLEPLLLQEAIKERLDEVVGVSGWSFRYRSFGPGVGCELEIGGVARSAIVEPVRDGEGPEECAMAAFARAAELFGLRPPVSDEESHWTDYDPEEGLALLPEQGTAAADSSEPVQPSDTTPTEAVKPEGQQAIDRLVERLKLEGQGLEAARLLVEYGGYGSDPQAARELYGRLRGLLTRRAETPT